MSDFLDLSPFKNCLADLAFDSKNSKGRPHKGGLDEDYCYYSTRDPFKADKKKHKNSKSRRRSKDKTQVHKVPFNIHIRTRSDHMTEVSDNAETIGDTMGLNENLCETCGFLHDHGHGPYGHACEKELTKLLQEETNDNSVFFDHSLNSVMVLEFVERSGRGLNLCYETDEIILNHSLRTDFIVKKGGLQEAGVVRVADKISYLPSDVNDALLLGYLNINKPEHKLIFDCVKKLGWNKVKQEPSQRLIINKFVHAICKESAAKGHFSFTEGEVYETFKTLKNEMYDKVYLQIPWTKEKDIVRQVFTILRDSSLDEYIKACELGGFKPRNPEVKPNPYLVTTLLTDRNMNKLKTIERSLTLKNIILETPLYQIVPYLMDNHIDLTSIYCKWSQYSDKSLFLEKVLWPVLVKHHNP